MSPILKKSIRFLSGLLIILVGIFLMNGLIGMKEPPSIVLPETLPRPVKTEVVFNTDLSPKIPVEGRVEAWHRIDLFAEVNGVLKIGGKEFREGVEFNKGDVIIKLDDSEARAQLMSARAQFLQLATGILATVKVDFPNRIHEWEAFVKNIDIKITLPNLPKTQSDREKFYIVNRGINASYHGIKASEERLSKYRIVAPFNGRVAAALVTPGALVLGGQPLGSFVGSGEYEIKSSLNSDFLSIISEGDKVEFMIDSVIVAEGELDRISSNVNPTTQSATAYFRISSVSENLELRDGMYLAGVVFADEIPDCYSIPTSLLEDGLLFAVEGDILKKIKAETVFKSFENTLVRGLEDGTVILSDRISDAYVGMKVNPSANR
jgi:membrane fusion protein (multidrug efflux system)